MSYSRVWPIQSTVLINILSHFVMVLQLSHKNSISRWDIGFLVSCCCIFELLPRTPKSSMWKSHMRYLPSEHPLSWIDSINWMWCWSVHHQIRLQCLLNFLSFKHGNSLTMDADAVKFIQAEHYSCKKFFGGQHDDPHDSSQIMWNPNQL